MNRRISFLLCGVSLFLAACDEAAQEFRIPVQNYARVMELDGREPGRLHGTVVFPSAYAQRSVRFSLGERRFVTEPDGRFLIEKVPAGEYPLYIRVKSYEPIQRTVVVPAGQAAFAGRIILSMARGKVIGRLVAENGRSAAEVGVRLTPLGDLARTDDDGIFQFIGVQSGDHSLLIADPQYLTYNRKFTLNSGEHRNLGNIKVFRKARAPVSHTAVLREKKVLSSVAREVSE